jgi:DNA-binding NarL/FixJ family response regulator
LKKSCGCLTNVKGGKGEKTGSASGILVVDSDSEERDYISGLLGNIGYETVHAASGEEAVALARRQRPQLVLLEVCLSDVSGYEVLRELRRLFGDQLPVMFVSRDRAESVDRVAGLLLGADDYVAKPFAPDELTARVQRLIIRSTLGEGRSGDPRLTSREGEVLQLLARGLDEPEIAKELVITSKTVATHIQHILQKLGVHSRAQAVAVAHRSGLAGGRSS